MYVKPNTNVKYNPYQVKLRKVRDFKKELSNLEFLEVEDHKKDGCLVLVKDSTKWQRIWSGDWVFQIQQDRITKDWYACDLDNVLNLKNIKQIVCVFKILGKYESI